MLILPILYYSRFNLFFNRTTQLIRYKRQQIYKIRQGAGKDKTTWHLQVRSLIFLSIISN